MTKLSVNVNKVALLRNTRALGIPSVLRAAEIALKAGAAGITVHPRPDQRHIRPQDVRELSAMLKDWPQAEFNIEGNPFHSLIELVRETRPQQCTLVPDDAAQSTSDHGWDLQRDASRLAPLIAELKDIGVRVSLFMDAVPASMALAAELGADRVELYTEPYAQAFGGAGQARALESYAATAKAAQAHGLGVNAGHDLNLPNTPVFLQAVPGVLEVSIGHALIADALEFGLGDAVQRYLQACGRSSHEHGGKL